jgi:hypothetical protein
MICTRGFKNVYENERPVGFQLKVRITYYRGIPASCVEAFDVTVDGEKFPVDQVTFSIGGRSIPLTEIGRAVDVRWPFGDPATLTIRKPGGLKPGIHDVEVVETLRISYMPNSRSVAMAKKKVTLVI